MVPRTRERMVIRIHNVKFCLNKIFVTILEQRDLIAQLDHRIETVIPEVSLQQNFVSIFQHLLTPVHAILASYTTGTLHLSKPY